MPVISVENVIVLPAQNTFEENNGFYVTGAITGTVFQDANGNGQQDPCNDDRRAVVEQALALQDGRQPARRAQLPQDGHHRHGVRRRDDGAKQGGDGQRRVGVVPRTDKDGGDTLVIKELVHVCGSIFAAEGSQHGLCGGLRDIRIGDAGGVIRMGDG